MFEDQDLLDVVNILEDRDYWDEAEAVKWAYETIKQLRSDLCESEAEVEFVWGMVSS